MRIGVDMILENARQPFLIMLFFGKGVDLFAHVSEKLKQANNY